MKSADTDNDSTADVFYEFDALGRRVARDDGTQDTIFVQVGQQTIADYVSGTAAASPEYTYAWGSYIDELILRTEPSGTDLYYHRNQQYSTYAITNSSGSIQERYTYSPYGELTITDASGTTRSASTNDTRYTYTGREWDADLDLYHFRARLYVAAAGSFCSRDPIGYRQVPHLSAALFGPKNLDPSGREVVDADMVFRACAQVTSALAGGLDLRNICPLSRFSFRAKCVPCGDGTGDSDPPKGVLGWTTCSDNPALIQIMICNDRAEPGLESLEDVRESILATIVHEFVHAGDYCNCSKGCSDSR
jgi:RHS repeat-associated protein